MIKIFSTKKKMLPVGTKSLRKFANNFGRHPENNCSQCNEFVGAQFAQHILSGKLIGWLFWEKFLAGRKINKFFCRCLMELNKETPNLNGN